MSIADIILTKPGGLTSTEVTTMRKPMIHTMPIPGCENYNADFFEKRGMSVKCDNTERIVEAIKELSKNNEEKNELILNQEKYIDNKSCEKVAEFIIAKLNRMWK
jgi:processive 1,2-diacylglycerol beta-glucosyltransferase